MDPEISDEILASLLTEIREIQLANGGTLRYGKDQKEFMERVMAFQEEYHLTHERCAEVLGLKPHVVGYLHSRYRQLFHAQPSSKNSIFKPVEIKNTPGETKGHFVFDFGKGLILHVQHVGDALQLIRGLKDA